MNKLLAVIAFVGTTILCTGSVVAQPEQQIKTEVQKKLGTNAKVKSVSPAPVSGLYEVLVGNDIFYTDASAKYLIQGEIIEIQCLQSFWAKIILYRRLDKKMEWLL